MAKKKANPVITYTEILARAARSVADEIRDLKAKTPLFPDTGAEDLLAILEEQIEDRRVKLEALESLYHIETGEILGLIDEI